MSSISPGMPRPTPSFILKNITVDDTDSSLKYSQGWNRSVLSSAFGGTFQSADTIGDGVSFSLPANAVAVYYFGFKQSSGALYEACLDCPTKAANNVDVIDAHDNETHSSEPTLLYEKTNLDSSVRHSLALLNVPDSRFGNTSTITLDSFVVTVQDEEALSASSASSTTSSISASKSAVMSSMGGASLMAINPTSTVSDVSTTLLPPGTQLPPTPPSTLPTPSSASASAALASASALSRMQSQSDLSAGERLAQTMRSPLVLTAVILGSLFIVCTTLYALMYFMRRRKRRRQAPLLMEGHWATRFFGEKGRGSMWGEGWLVGHGAGAGAGAGVVAGEGGVIKVAKGAMIEQLVPDRPTYASPPSRLNPPPAPATQRGARQWVGPGYHPFNASQAPARTVPRSAFPSASAGCPPFQNQQLVRTPSVGPTYTRALVPGSGPNQSSRVPSDSHVVANPYVAEARARVRDRARGIANGGWGGPGQAVVGPPPGYAYAGRPGPGAPDGGLQRNDSLGSQYSQ